MSRQKKDEKENLIENNISSDDYDEDNLKADTIPGEDEWADFSKAPQPKVPNVATSATN